MKFSSSEKKGARRPVLLVFLSLGELIVLELILKFAKDGLSEPRGIIQSALHDSYDRKVLSGPLGVDGDFDIILL
jgi:hypothetical protein